MIDYKFNEEENINELKNILTLHMIVITQKNNFKQLSS